MSYMYLFPYDEVNKNSRIIIYGGDEVGRQFLSQIVCLGYCNCLFIVDKDYREIQQIDGVEVRAPEEIRSCEYDKIVIASKAHNDEIYDSLRDLNVPNDKIVRKVILSEYIHRRRLITPDPKNSAAWNAYYDRAEKSAESQFKTYFQPILSKFEDINLDEVLDFACGHGRIANIFSKISRSITCCDVNDTAIEFCKKRFLNRNDCSFKFVKNETEGTALKHLPLGNNTFSFIYSWDAMIHFSYKWLDFYIKEFYRVLSNNSYVVFHHSNYANTEEFARGTGSENWFDNSGWRAVVSYEDVKFIAQNHGFIVPDQQIIDRSEPRLDCISILKKI